MTDRRTRQRQRRGLLGRLAALALRALGATWRVRAEGENPLIDQRGPQIGAVWHRNILLAAFVFRDKGFCAPVSRSLDGDVIATALESLGFAPPPRGSSSRGGPAALRGLVRMLDSGVVTSIQPDGPRGPARRSKVGIVSLARLSGIPITPVAMSASPCVRFRSWDRTILPLPFARVICAYGPQVHVPPDASEEEEERLRALLDQRMNALTDEFDRRVSRQR